jgi:cytochrome P450
MSLPTLPLVDPDTFVSGVPYSLLAQLRRESAVVWIDEPPLAGWSGGPGFWLVLRHVDVTDVLRQPQIFSSWLGGTQVRDPATPAALAFARQMMLNQDPPEHSRLRRLLTRSFTPRAVALLEAGIRANAAALVDRALGADEAGECDFATEIAADLPLLTLADILGVPESDRWLLFDWSNRVIGYQDPDYASSARFDATVGTELARHAVMLRPEPDAAGRMPDPRTRDGMPDLYAYAHLLAEYRRQAPGEDVTSILLAQLDSVDGQVSQSEFETLFWLFSVAGNETLRNGLPGGMIALLEHPAAQASLRADPDWLDTAVDEMLRWWTPVMVFRRTATTDATIADVRIRAGDKVVVSFASANRDEAVFADPDAFDPDRQPNPHLSFGHGPHFCLGAHLARVQMKALFAALLSRTSTIEYAGTPTYLRSTFQRGVKHLPIRWRR